MSEESKYNYRQIDKLVHSRIRLAVMTILVQQESAPFSYLKDQTGATDGNLSSHLSKLVEAGYITEEKEFVDKKPKTTYFITKEGRKAFEEYLDRLENLIDL